MMRRSLIAVLSLLIASCFSQSSLDGFPLLRSDRPEAVFFVETHSGDKYAIAETIAEIMGSRGLNAVVVEPDTYDYRVTYIDRWYWDMRMYLIDIRIDVRDSETDVLVATGRSYQTSLAAIGRRREHFVEAAIGVLLDGPRVGEAGGAPRRRNRRH